MEDPPGALNLYQYTLWNPLNLIDPDGEREKTTEEGAKIDRLRRLADQESGLSGWFKGRIASAYIERWERAIDAAYDGEPVEGVPHDEPFFVQYGDLSKDGYVANMAMEFYPRGQIDPTYVVSQDAGPAPAIAGAPGRGGAAARSGGRLGNATTRGHVAAVADEMESRGWEITHGGGRGPEEYIRGASGGRRGSAYPDITAVKRGRVLRVNTVDTLRDGVTMTGRESRNATRIRALTGGHLVTIPKPVRR